MNGSYEQRVLEFITANEPCTRNDLLKEFKFAAPKTIYQAVRKLLGTNKIQENEFRELGVSFNTPVWKLPAVIRNFTNLSPITNAFARQHSEFIKMARELSQKYPVQATVLLNDLIMIVNSANEEYPNLAKQYQYTAKVDVHELTIYFSKLEELISQYPKDKIINQNS